MPPVEWPDRSEAECLRHLRAGGTVIVRSSAAKWWGMIVLFAIGAIVCGAATIALIVGIADPTAARGTASQVGSAVVAIVFGLCALVCVLAVPLIAVQRLRNAESLVLTPSGLGSFSRRDLHRGAGARGTIASPAAGPTANEIPWTEILRFEIVILPSKQPDALAPKQLIYTLSPAGMARIEARTGLPLRARQTGRLRRMAPNAWWADPAVMRVVERYRGRLPGLLSLLSAAHRILGRPYA